MRRIRGYPGNSLAGSYLHAHEGTFKGSLSRRKVVVDPREAFAWLDIVPPLQREDEVSRRQYPADTRGIPMGRSGRPMSPALRRQAAGDGVALALHRNSPVPTTAQLRAMSGPLPRPTMAERVHDRIGGMHDLDSWRPPRRTYAADVAPAPRRTVADAERAPAPAGDFVPAGRSSGFSRGLIADQSYALYYELPRMLFDGEGRPVGNDPSTTPHDQTAVYRVAGYGQLPGYLARPVLGNPQRAAIADRPRPVAVVFDDSLPVHEFTAGRTDPWEAMVLHLADVDGVLVGSALQRPDGALHRILETVHRLTRQGRIPEGAVPFVGVAPFGSIQFPGERPTAGRAALDHRAEVVFAVSGEKARFGAEARAFTEVAEAVSGGEQGIAYVVAGGDRLAAEHYVPAAVEALNTRSRVVAMRGMGGVADTLEPVQGRIDVVDHRAADVAAALEDVLGTPDQALLRGMRQAETDIPRVIVDAAALPYDLGQPTYNWPAKLEVHARRAAKRRELIRNGIYLDGAHVNRWFAVHPLLRQISTHDFLQPGRHTSRDPRQRLVDRMHEQVIDVWSTWSGVPSPDQLDAWGTVPVPRPGRAERGSLGSDYDALIALPDGDLNRLPPLMRASEAAQRPEHAGRQPTYGVKYTWGPNASRGAYDADIGVFNIRMRASRRQVGAWLEANGYSRGPRQAASAGAGAAPAEKTTTTVRGTLVGKMLGALGRD